MRKGSSLLLIILIILGGLIGGCGAGNTFILGSPVTVTRNNVNISVDPRVELMAIVQYLSNHDEFITDVDFTYRSNVDEYFADFREHKAVTIYEEMVLRGFKFSAPSSFALSLTYQLEVDSEVQLGDYLLSAGGGLKKLRQLAAALRDFSIDSKFNDFFNGHESYYLDNAYNIALLLGDYDYVSELQDYYGINYNSFNIIPVPLYGGGGGFGPHIVRQGRIDAYSVLCPFSSMTYNDIPFYGDAEFFKYLIRHEFSHSYVNRFTDMFNEEAMEYEYLLDPIQTDMAAMGYGYWITCLNEHIVRAVTVRLAYAEGRRKGDKVLASKLQSNFIYINALVDKLKEYEDNRDIYPDFKSFYLELLKALD